MSVLSMLSSCIGLNTQLLSPFFCLVIFSAVLPVEEPYCDVFDELYADEANDEL